MTARYPNDMLRDYKAAHRNVCASVRGEHVGAWYGLGTKGLVTIMAGQLPEPARILEEAKA